MARAISLIDVIDSDLGAILGLRGSVFQDEITSWYFQIQLNYLQSDLDGLKRLQRELPQELTILETLLRARIALKEKKASEKILKELETLSSDEQWAGEVRFVQAAIAIELGNNESAKKYSLSAYQNLKRVGARKKAVRSLMNALAAESRIFPEKHFIPDLFHILREAKQAKDITSISNTLMNISREYQKLGAYRLSLKYANQALAKIQAHAGNKTYFLALAHRAYLFCCLEMFSNAQLDIEAVMASEFPEALAAIQIIEEKFSVKTESKFSVADATPAWKERQKEKVPEGMSALEQKVLDSLAKQPRSLSELGQALYGESLGLDVIANRAKNVLSRIRKREPGLIQFAAGKYRLGDVELAIRWKKM